MQTRSRSHRKLLRVVGRHLSTVQHQPLKCIQSLRSGLKFARSVRHMPIARPEPSQIRTFAGSASATPMMKQYLSIRHNEQYTGCVVFFQMGEFYECFFEDAEVASRALGISLTARGKHLGLPIPMAGVPLHAGASFIARMVRAGYKVVVVDQVETPLAARSRGPSALVKRQVTRIVTPGTVTEEALLSPGEANHLAAVSLAADGSAAAVAWCDVSTGASYVQPCRAEEVSDALNAVAPREVLLPDASTTDSPPELMAALRQLHSALGVRHLPEGGEGGHHDSADADLGGFGSHTVYRRTCNECSCVTLYDPPAAPGAAEKASELSEAEGTALQAVSQYVEWALQGTQSALRAPVRVGIAGSAAGGDAGSSDASSSHAAPLVQSAGTASQHLPVMSMDHWTRRGLELHRPLHGRHRGRGSLLAVIDFTSTSAGSRLLDARLASPLAHADGVRHRMAAVAWLRQRGFFNRQLRRALARCGDLERAQQRVMLAASRGVTAAQPQDTAPTEEQSETPKAARRRAGRTVRSNAGAAVPLGDIGSTNTGSTPREADLLCIRDGLGVALGVGRALSAGLETSIQQPLEPAPLQWVLQASEVDFDKRSPVANCDQAAQGSDVLRTCAAALLLHDSTQGDVPLPALEAVHRELCAALVGEAPSVELMPPGQDTPVGDAEDEAPPSSDTKHPHGGVTGSAIRTGYNPELDALRQLRDNSTAAVAQLQAEYRTQLGIPTLKIKHTSEQGFTIEVPSKSADSVPVLPKGSSANADSVSDAWVWSRTLKNTVRFKNKHLGTLDRQLADAATKAAALERVILRDLASKLAAVGAGVHAVARATAVLDVAASCAHAADVLRLTQPEIVDTTTEQPPAIELRGSRHLVVEQGLLGAWAWRYAGGASARSAGMLMDKHAQGGNEEHSQQDADVPLPIASTDPMSRAFVPNDAVLGRCAGTGESAIDGGDAASENCLLITGPNMGGKSTYLRQVAQAAILAQMGSFVPADAAHVSVVDAVFARVGASDDVSRDRSTFMCEMTETAAILNKATQKSLVVVDEIGRGTAAADGLAIAWAVLQELAQGKRCRTLFATHFHELAAASQRSSCSDSVACYTAEVHMTPLGPVLTHRIVPGASNASYGIHVARQAGVPDAVLQVATDTLQRLQAEDGSGEDDWWRS